jgi:Secretion system C-terminal sorting domain
MRFINFLSTLCVLYFSQNALAQHNPDIWCGTKGKSPWLVEYQKNKVAHADNGLDTNWLYVPMTIHSVGNDAGGGHFNFDKIIQAVCQMNENFVPARIRFYLRPDDPVRILNNSAWYEHDWWSGSEMIEENYLQDRLNAFVVSDPAGACGYSWHDVIVLGKNCSGSGNSTWTHEAGHHFSLPHTFSGWEGEDLDFSGPAPNQINGHGVEKVDGSNCLVSGDGFCDTKADYLNYRWPCNDSLRSNVIQKDPNGVEFRSDATLFMSYALDQCESRFSQEQISAMRENLQTEHNIYQQIDQWPSGIDDSGAQSLVSPIDSIVSPYNDVTFKWNPVPGANFYTVELGLFEDFTPRLIYKSVRDTFYRHTGNLPKNKLLRWRVHAYSNFDLCNPNDNMQVGLFFSKDLSATNELESSLSVSFQPNPVFSGGAATLQITADRKSAMQLQVHDMNGKLVSTRELTVIEGENAIDVDAGTLQAGLYLVSLRNELGSVLRKMLVI